MRLLNPAFRHSKTAYVCGSAVGALMVSSDAVLKTSGVSASRYAAYADLLAATFSGNPRFTPLLPVVALRGHFHVSRRDWMTFEAFQQDVAEFCDAHGLDTLH